MARGSKTTDEQADETVDEETGTEEATDAETKTKKQKHDLPTDEDGNVTHVTPVGFGHLLKEKRGVDIRPQVIYGYVKNNKEFQKGVSQHTDGRVLVHVETGLAWWDAKEQRKAEKAAEAAEEAAAPAEAAAEGE